MKLIAIRTLKGCHPTHLKALKEEHLYYFYETYKIDGNQIVEYKDLDDEFFFYERKNSIVNVSSIVGKNGSGKSSLVELFIKIINNFSERQGQSQANLEYVSNVKAELFFEADTYYRIRVYNNRVTAYKYRKTTKRVDRQIQLKSLKDEMFYSIVVNNSHYAYNSLLEGTWMNGLFSKNDGYRTPIVLNPFRDKGNININVENHLVNTRLISNFLLPTKEKEQHFRRLTPLFTAKHLTLRVKESKMEKELFTEFNENDEPSPVRTKDLNVDKDGLLSMLNSAIPFSYTKINKKQNKLALDYLVYKMVSIAIKYYNHDKKYFDTVNKNFVASNLREFCNILKNDTSHVTLKLRQTINFLRLKKLRLKNQQVDLDKYAKSIVSIGRVRRHWEIFELAELSPPPLFDIEILMESNGGEIVPFKYLSSGEKQLIYSVSSVLYHLANLDSIFRTKANRVVYRWVNIILEEVELYAHPEMQRQFVQYLLDSISHREFRMRGINICIVTHSPFVLSDIPRHNLLFLPDPLNKEQQIDEDFQTFGANIYDLLSHTFFLDQGAIGEHARQRIQFVIKMLNEAVKKNTEDSANFVERLLPTINIIGEPLLKQKLLELYEQIQVKYASNN